MKTLSKTQFWALAFCIKLLPLLCMLVVWRGDLWHYRKNVAIYVGIIIFEAIALTILLLPFFVKKQVIENRSQELVHSFYVVVVGFLSMYSVYTTNEADLWKFACVAFALSVMCRGNRQSLIGQNAPNAGLMYAFSERTYKKSQRILGRILFGVGLFGLVLFLVTPSQYCLAAVGVFIVVLYISAFVAIYKSGKAVDE